MFLIKLKRINRLAQIQSLSHISSKASEVDLFGIKEVTNHDIKGTLARENVDLEEFKKKYAFLNNLNRVDNEESLLKYPHGHVRLDRDNQPKYHGQFDEDNQKIRFDIDSLEDLNANEVDVKSSQEQTKETKEIKENLENNEINQLMQESSNLSNQNNETKYFLNQKFQQSQINQQINQNKTFKHDPSRPYREKIDTSNVDIYDLEPIKKAYSNQKLVFNINLMYKSFNFKFEDQWSNWIKIDEQSSKSPLAEFVREQQLLLNPVLTERLEEMRSSKLRKNRFKEDFKEEIKENDEENVEEEDSNLYSPLKSLNELENELENEQESDDNQSLNQDTMKPELNIESIFKSEPSVSEEQVITTEEITALEYLRKIKNKDIEADDKYLKKILDKKTEKEMKIDTVTFEKAKTEYDSKGFINYKKQIFNLQALNSVDCAFYLESETFFNQFGLVAFNKPYGLICPGDDELMGSEISDRGKKPIKLLSFLNEYAKLIAIQDKKIPKENTFEDLNNPKLYPIYKMDRNCTGVYLMAKNKETAIKLNEVFKKREFSEFYDAITKNVPSKEKATIDIPIELDKKDVRKRMILRPILPNEFQELMRPSRMADKAITNYRILKSNKSSSYLELNPLTSIRHQLRVHLSYGLNTPILGDHLYDRKDKVLYQKLPYDMLIGLKVRPQMTIHIPLHLHCKLLILNGMGKHKKDLLLKADLPDFFRENLKSLDLN